MIQATLPAMACFFNCSEDTIERFVKREYKSNFAAIFALKRQKGAISLRRTIGQTALGGNPGLLIFLAKQYLGMGDQLVIKTPGVIQDENKPDLTRLNDEQLDQLERLVESAHSGKLTAVTTPVSPQKEDGNPGATSADPAPDPGGEVAPAPPPVRPPDQT